MDADMTFAKERNAPLTHAALQTFEIGVRALNQVAEDLDGDLGAAIDKAVDLILASTGRLIVCGVGKSGHIGRKTAATLASTGTPAFFVHPTEASHGDLGMITPADAIFAISWSGETAELGDMIHYSRRFQVPLIAMTWNRDSTLARAADVTLALPKVREACPHDLAPTTSSLIQLALGDALAMVLLERRGFTAHGFKIFHPGGKLASRLLLVDQMMHRDEEMPVVKVGLLMSEVLIAIAGCRYGCVGVLDESGYLVGMVTDGDLRRHMSKTFLDMPVETVMTADPITASLDMFASAALAMMNRRRITAMFVVEDRKPLGIIHLHDLVRAGIV